MARSFGGGSTDKINGGDCAVFNSASQLTISAWMQRADFSAEVYVGKGATTGDLFEIRQFTDGNIYVGAITGGLNGFGQVANNSTAMLHLCAVYDGTATGNSNRLKFYINGSLQTLTYTGTVPSSLSSFSGINFYMGYAEFANTSSFGTIAEVGLWSIPLSADDVTVLAGGGAFTTAGAYSPRCVRPDKGTNYWPLIGSQSPEPDFIGGKSGTVTGTTKADHIRILAY